MLGNYLDGINLKTLALNLPDDSVGIYYLDENYSNYKDYITAITLYRKYNKLEKDTSKKIHDKINSGEIERMTDKHKKYADNLKIYGKLSFENMQLAIKLHAKLVTEKIVPKNEMPKTKYTVLYNEVKLNKFTHHFFRSDEMKIIDNSKNEIIAYQQRYFMLPRNIIFDFSGVYNGEYIIEYTELIRKVFSRMDSGLGGVSNFDRKFKNNFKGDSND